MSDLFTSEEDEVMRLILRRMGKELEPRDMRPDSLRAYRSKVEFAIDRTMTWLENLKPDDQSINSVNHSDESGQPDSSDEFRSS